MSYSTCYNCNEMVPWYDKYCEDCIGNYGFPDIRDYQRGHLHTTEQRKVEVKKDLQEIADKKPK
jgi:hypothetical protein